MQESYKPHEDAAAGHAVTALVMHGGAPWACSWGAFTSKEHGHVSVMAACMHLPRVRALKVHIYCLLQGQLYLSGLILREIVS